jgi:two-component system OmpR family sensor kinase/two-component system sensor histidine kinase QseC
VAPLLAALIWFSVGASLAPLRRVAAEVKQRDAHALGPLPDDGAPAEIAPLMQAINALLARLRESFSAQRAFVADAAHELRSPLTALKLQLGLLARAPSEAARAEALQALAEGIERATRLVEQLLTLARSEPGAVEAARERVDLAETARLSIADVVALAAARGVEIALEAPVPVPVWGHAPGLRILVRNLADNAVRYTPGGGQVEIAVTAAPDGAVLLVDDSGPGIPPAERERVFDRFYRRNLGDDAASGSGLGLAIVRAIADQHGARIALETSPLGGLRVRVAFAGAAAARSGLAAANVQGASA